MFRKMWRGTLAGDGATQIPIEFVEVGQRVATDGGVSNSADGLTASADPYSTDVDPAAWRLVTITAGDWYIRTLKPVNWIDELGLEPMESLRLAEVVDLVELGAPEDLVGTVASIESSPPIEGGFGRVVLTTVNHLNDEVFDLTLRGDTGEIETIGVTGGHRIYTEDLGWMSARDLVLGTIVRTATGEATVIGRLRRPGVLRVFNMTVEADHVYYVGDLSALVHNQCIDNHHLKMQQFYGPNSGPLQDIPRKLHQELHDAIREAIDDEFAGMGAPSAFNGGQRAWELFYKRTMGAFERVDAIINMVTDDFLKANGIW